MEPTRQQLPGEEGIVHVIKEDLEDAVEHGVMVSRLSRLLACELGEPEEFLEEISMAGMLHDIGKLKLSKYLYGRNKSSLQIEEMKYVRMHPAFSYNILKEKGYSDFILKAVYHHHENYDGSGYPDNLKGEKIPKAARILRTCDVYAALISDRPYRAAFDTETAIEMMIEEVKNFDMEVFLAFQRMVHQEEFCAVEAIISEERYHHLEGIHMF